MKHNYTTTIFATIILISLLTFLVLKYRKENYYYTGPMYYSSDMFEKGNNKLYFSSNPHGCDCPFRCRCPHRRGRQGVTASELNIDGHRRIGVHPSNWRRDDTHFETHKLF